MKLACQENYPSENAGLLRPCSELVGMMSKDIISYIDQKIFCFYHQYDLDVFKVTQSVQGKPPGTVSDPQPLDPASCALPSPVPFGKPCNLAVGEIAAPKPDYSPTFADCGKPAFLGTPPNSNTSIVYASGTVGTMEQAYLYGAYVQALRSCRNEVLAEIKKSNAITGSSCGMAAYKDVNQRNQDLAASDSSLKNAGIFLEGQSIEKFCKGGGPSPTPSDPPDSPARANHRIAVCHLAAAMASVEEMNSRMATCEIYGRWTRLWANSHAKLSAAIQKATQDAMSYAQGNVPATSVSCPTYTDPVQATKCLTSGNGSSALTCLATDSKGNCTKWKCCPTSPPPKPQDPQTLRSTFNQVYGGYLQMEMTQAIQALFPEDGSTCQSASGGH